MSKQPKKSVPLRYPINYKNEDTNVQNTPSVEEPELTECPYCGGISGFYWKFADVQVQFCEWDGTAVECNNDEALYTRKMRCQDCDHIVEKELKNVRIKDRHALSW